MARNDNFKKQINTALCLTVIVLIWKHAALSAPNIVAYQWRSVTITAGGFVDGLVFSPAQEGLILARTDIGGAYKWDKKARQWQPLADWAGGKDGNLLGCESVAVDPQDPQRFYLALGTYSSRNNPNGAIVGTADGGKTWRRTDVPFKMGGNEDGRSAGERLAVDPNDGRILFFGSRHDGLWRSADYGLSWSHADGFPVQGTSNSVGTVFVVFGKVKGKRGTPTAEIYAGVSQTGLCLYRSKDGGMVWQPVSGGPADLVPQRAALSADGALYMTLGNAPGPNGISRGAVWKWDTASGAWADISPPQPFSRGGGFCGLTLDSERLGTVMVSTLDRWNPGDTLFRTRDAGHTWTDIGPPAQRDSSLTPYVTFGARTARFGWWIAALAIDPFHSNHALYGTGATIWETEDLTNADTNTPTHWAVGARGIEETAVLDLISPPLGAHLFSGLGDIGGFRHDDFNASPAGGLWQPIDISTTSLDFAQNAPLTIARVGNGGPGAFSTDGGSTWTQFASAPSPGATGGTIAVSADGKTFVWAASGNAPMLSRNKGATWTPCVGTILGRRMVPLADRADPNVFYLTAGGRLWRSTDGGATFSLRGEMSPFTLRLRATPNRTGDLWSAAGRNGVFHSVDGGATFTAAALPNAQNIGFGKAAPGQSYPALYVTGQTETGASAIFRSDDSGKTWTRLNDDQHQYGFSGGVVTGDPRIYGRVYFGTNGRGILYGDPAPK